MGGQISNLMHVPLKSWANGTRINATSVDRFTGGVCKKKISNLKVPDERYGLCLSIDTKWFGHNSLSK